MGAFVLFQCIVSFQFVITFVGSHLNETLLFVEHEEQKIPHSFLEHQLHTSLDFDPTHPIVSFFLGGFNAHVAHHMFPHICSVHYPAITRIIQETSTEYNMPYKEMSTVQLYISHFKYLYQLGRDAQSPFTDYLYKKTC